MKLAIYSDHWYRQRPDGLYADRALVVFLAGVARRLERTILVGQLDPELPRAHYRVPDELEFAALPSYPSLLSPRALVAMARSLRRFWALLGEVDAVWLLGPHPLCLAFALLALLRRRRVFLGVRQDFPVYARSRHPGRRVVHLAADVLEGAYRLLARRCPTVVVGPELARNYGRADRLLEISVSLVREDDLANPDKAAAGDWPENPRALSVGRLETEKNPLLLADVLAALGPSWRLSICGEGPLEPGLSARLGELGVADRAELVGYLPIDGGLMDLYRDSDVLLHVSWTEGVPQVLLEAFAAGLPVVATAVGGVPEAVGDAALLVPPGDAAAAAEALERVAADPALRERLVRAGLTRVGGQTLEAESGRVADFLAGSG